MLGLDRGDRSSLYPLCNLVYGDKQVRPRQKSSYDVDIGDVGQLVALPGEAPDVSTKVFSSLLSAVFEIPWVSRTFVRVLKVSHEDLL